MIKGVCISTNNFHETGWSMTHGNHDSPRKESTEKQRNTSAALLPVSINTLRKCIYYALVYFYRSFVIAFNEPSNTKIPLSYNASLTCPLSYYRELHHKMSSSIKQATTSRSRSSAGLSAQHPYHFDCLSVASSWSFTVLGMM